MWSRRENGAGSLRRLMALGGFYWDWAVDDHYERSRRQPYALAMSRVLYSFLKCVISVQIVYCLIVMQNRLMYVIQ